MAGSPTVSVIIPHLNQPDAAGRCLASLAAQSYPADRVEIIMVDNGSTVPLDWLAERHPHVRLLHEPQPGPGHARNRGVTAATGEVLAFIDADCRADPDWLRDAVAGLSAPGSTGVVGGDVRIDYLHPARLTPLEAYESVFAYRQKLYIEQRGFSGTGNLAVRREVFDRIGPFGGIDIAEDMDWGRRATASGHPARYRAGMIIYHPARTRFADLEAKWRRHVAHELEDHRRRDGSSLAWRLRAMAVMLSAIPHAGKIMLSDRLSGLSARLAGVGVLFRIRWYRFRQMMAQTARGHGNAAAEWNRAG
jgi:glycosyltransferase involved in cell wall biosynthesis